MHDDNIMFGIYIIFNINILDHSTYKMMVNSVQFVKECVGMLLKLCMASF